LKLEEMNMTTQTQRQKYFGVDQNSPDEWIQMKNEFAERERLQETAAFMSDPDYRSGQAGHSYPITGAEFLTMAFAGSARITVVSKRTGTRYTYKISKPRKQSGRDVFFISVLTSPDNETGYSFIGTVFDKQTFKWSGKSSLSSTCPSVQGFSWLIRNMKRSDIGNQVTLYREGHCLRCGRTLTVPESIVSGYGPECVQMIGIGSDVNDVNGWA